MSANLNARNFTQPAVYAENAITVIPVNPNSGIAYRDPNVNPATYAQGQPFDSIVDSRIWNQLLYALSAFCREGEMFGFFRWSPLTNYSAGASVTATNGELYRAVRASGPGLGVGARNPMDYPDYWQTLKDWLSGSDNKAAGGLVPVGMIDLLPFRYNALPFGWYFCNGERYPDTTLAGQALQGLPQGLRNDWNISTTGSGTNVPLLLNSDGKGYFLRAVDGMTRMPGSIEQDATRAVTATATSTVSGGGSVTASGTISNATGVQGGISASGVFSATATGVVPEDAGDYQQSLNTIKLSINATVPTPSVSTIVNIQQQNVDTENRPTNIGMTPAIFLGV